MPDQTTCIHLDEHCSVTLQRTLRIPDDGNDHPLPPGLGSMTAYVLDEHHYVVPMHRAEALWLSFSAPYWRPHALRVGVGAVDAITGEPFGDALDGGTQNYVVVPDQPWLDGINAGDGFVRQFVAIGLGEGLTVESQLNDGEEVGGMSLALHEPRPGRFPDEAPAFDPFASDGIMYAFAAEAAPAAMGIGAGGRMRQEIYADDHGVDTWEPEPCVTVRIELVDAIVFAAITGLPVPPPPVDALAYTAAGLPWFELEAAHRRDIAAAEKLAGIRSIAELEDRVEDGLPIPAQQVVRLLALREPAA